MVDLALWLLDLHLQQRDLFRINLTKHLYLTTLNEYYVVSHDCESS